MPASPTPAQSAASRRNAAASSGPRQTSRTRLNARTHGFTATIAPPSDPDDRRLYDEILVVAYEEFLPCGRAEMMAVEELAALEVRRIRIQGVLLETFDFGDEAGLKRLGLLSRYETDTLNKIDKKRKHLHELQSSRAQRHSLSLESALIQDRLRSLRGTARRQARLLADRALSREMADLAIGPDEAEVARRALLGSASFRKEAPQAAAAVPSPGLEPVEGVPDQLPGPPWDPWRGVSVEQLEEWNDRLIQHRIAELRREIESLETATEPPPELLALQTALQP